ncbi:c-type cytochrome biogenesis protein CcmI [Gemmobacter denitrificans]|uniref:C-type cytochrome biogenesis protein CcmI n=1 Tax=Gemmobacter denitrificans TaxID=3123040 RepID=A0ABU8BPK7_9RHOB
MAMFWGTVGALLIAAAAAIWQGLRRGQAVAELDRPAAHDLQVYRDQLAELERDRARGVVAPDEAERLRAEIGRRLLEADRAARDTAPQVAQGPGLGVSFAAAALVLAGGAALYLLDLGAPGYPDMPLAARKAQAEDWRKARPSQAEAESAEPAPALPEGADPEFLALMEKLRKAVAGRPDDLQGQRLLAENEARLGDYRAAARAQAEVLRLLGNTAKASDFSFMAEMLIASARGYVSPEAEAALQQALSRDPQDQVALYYSGLMLAQIGRPDQAFPLWRDLLETSAPDAPFAAALRAELPRLAAQAGERYQPPAPPAAAPALPGPDAAAVEAAGEMAAGDRQAMIEGMVAQLNDRLAREGGTAEEWARLISSLGVLGQTERAAAIHAEALQRFAGREGDLDLIRAAGAQAGVAP